ncbi:MAG: GNAT family N-acetyltransferase [Planctomycetes bacterium]|nr:GNAT family N-acetyltransferase [Planctomycetota bacterium]
MDSTIAENIQLQVLEWDSSVLGLSSGLVDCTGFDQLDPAEHGDNIGRLINKSALEFITIKLPEKSSEVVNYLIRRGASLIGTEVVLAYRNDFIAATGKSIGGDYEIRFCNRISEHDDLVGLSGDFRFSRFFLDRNIPENKAIDLWRQSIRNHCQGQADELVVCLFRDQPCGFIALDFKDDKAVFLDIVGVIRDFRGRGLSRAMIDRVIDRYSNSYDIFVETQPLNKEALQAYQNAGFRLHSSKYILHYWNKQPQVKIGQR